MTQADQEAKRRAHAAKVEAAWVDLSLSPAFKTVMEAAKVRFGFSEPSFISADGFNSHAAAQRDGHKQVIEYFTKRLARGLVGTDKN